MVLEEGRDEEANQMRDGEREIVEDIHFCWCSQPRRWNLDSRALCYTV